MQKSPVATTNPLRESEKAALLTLLGDEDEAVYQAVRAKLLSVGAQVRDWLQPHVRSANRLLAQRAADIVRELDARAAHHRFWSFCLTHRERFDLEEAAWMLAQTTYPEINVPAYQAVLDEFAGELRPQVALYRRGSQILGRINALLFQEQGFTSNLDSEDVPDNCYLNRVMDRRVGNAYTLSLLYMAVARRLALPIAPVDLAGHCLCRYQTAAEEIYIDPFHHGRLLTRTDCVHHLIRINAEVKDDYLWPVTPLHWLCRLCDHLAGLYRAVNRPAERARIEEYRAVMSFRLFE